MKPGQVDLVQPHNSGVRSEQAFIASQAAIMGVNCALESGRLALELLQSRIGG